MTPPPVLWLPARAKLNLVLRIVGRRADGYHLLETLFHALELHDDVQVELAPAGIALDVTADDRAFVVAPGPDNLVHRALAAVARRAGHRGGFAARLHKRIPPGGGLGGGSSDAAAALRLGNALLGNVVPDESLHGLAVALGADVPFFLRSGSQWGRGIGDELTAATVPANHFVLLVPPFGCATADVYKTYAVLWKIDRAEDSVPSFPVPETTDAALRIGFHNDLQRAAEQVQPGLAALRQRVGELGRRPVHMTGSGSTLFVACADAAAAARCADDLTPLRAEGVRIVVTRSVDTGVLDQPRPPDDPVGAGRQ